MSCVELAKERLGQSDGADCVQLQQMNHFGCGLVLFLSGAHVFVPHAMAVGIALSIMSMKFIWSLSSQVVAAGKVRTGSNMNSLGLGHYASSSDEEDAAHQQETQPTVAAVPEPQQQQTQLLEEHETALRALGVPAEPVGPANEQTQARIAQFIERQEARAKDTDAVGVTGSKFQQSLQEKKDVRNPYILEKVVDYFGIDELQSNFPTRVFDPHGLPAHDFTDALALEQKRRADEYAQQQAQRQTIAFVSSQQQQPY